MPLFGVGFALFLLFVFICELARASIIIETVHVTLSFIIVAIFALDDAFISTKHALELCNLMVQILLLDLVIARISTIFIIIRQQLVIVSVLATN